MEKKVPLEEDEGLREKEAADQGMLVFCKEFPEAGKAAQDDIQAAEERGEDWSEVSGSALYLVPGVPGGWMYNVTGPGAEYTYHILGPAFLREDLAAEFLDIIKEQGNGMLAGLLFRREYVAPEAGSPRMDNWIGKMVGALKTSQEAG